MRITSKYLKKWLEEEFKRLGINCPVMECYKTRFRSDDYHRGAATYIYKIGEESNSCSIFIFIPKWELEKALAEGKKLYLILRQRQVLVDAEVSYH